MASKSEKAETAPTKERGGLPRACCHPQERLRRADTGEDSLLDVSLHGRVQLVPPLAHVVLEHQPGHLRERGSGQERWKRWQAGDGGRGDGGGEGGGDACKCGTARLPHSALLVGLPPFVHEAASADTNVFPLSMPSHAILLDASPPPVHA